MPDLLYIIAVTGLSLSGLAAAIRLIEWLIRTDPRIIAQTGRWAVVGLAVLSGPLLLALLINEKWTASMVLAAMMLLAFAWYGPRLLQRAMRQRLAADWSSPQAGNLTPSVSVGNPELVQHAIAVLEEYLRRAATLPKQDATHPRPIGMQRSGGAGSACHNGSAEDRSYGPVSEAEALDILGLGADASEVEIKEAHQRLRELVRPEHGGSQYLAVKIDQARSLLLGQVNQTAKQPAASARPLP